MKEELIKTILNSQNKQMLDEELVHSIIRNKVSENINKSHEETLTFGDKMSDKLADFVGSWTFIIIFGFILILWMAINTVGMINHFDPYPFILLNLVLSCLAAIQAPIIMMSQNRQEEKDRMRAQNDYEINLKAEFIIEDLHNKVDKILQNQEEILKFLREE